MFQSRYQRGFRDAADGLSNTILMSEMGTNDGTPKVQGWTANDCPNPDAVVAPLPSGWFETVVLESPTLSMHGEDLAGLTVVRTSLLQHRSSTETAQLHSFRNAERLGLGFVLSIQLPSRWRSHSDGRCCCEVHYRCS